MNYLKKIGKAFIYVFSIIIVFTFIISFLNYINFLGTSLLTIFKIFIPILSLIVGGYIVGKNSKTKGWLEGIKFSIIFIVFLLLFNYLALGNAPEIKNIIYYLILVASATVGSMIGITKSNLNENN